MHESEDRTTGHRTHKDCGASSNTAPCGTRDTLKYDAAEQYLLRKGRFDGSPNQDEDCPKRIDVCADRQFLLHVALQMEPGKKSGEGSTDQFYSKKYRYKRQ